jgi:hypothetical protein
LWPRRLSIWRESLANTEKFLMAKRGKEPLEDDVWRVRARKLRRLLKVPCTARNLQQKVRREYNWSYGMLVNVIAAGEGEFFEFRGACSSGKWWALPLPEDTVR